MSDDAWNDGKLARRANAAGYRQGYTGEVVKITDWPVATWPDFMRGVDEGVHDRATTVEGGH